ncbi:MAG: hypothetical protein ABRQ38_08895 [Candidatus Eremiobacterota bacterium]
MKPDIILWDFCSSYISGPPRFTASKVLNFMCTEYYKNVWITDSDRNEVMKRFLYEEGKLLIWSHGSSAVDYICRKLRVNIFDVNSFLDINGFDINNNYNPGKWVRKGWFLFFVTVIYCDTVYR